MKKIIFAIILTVLISGAVFADYPGGFGIGVQGGYGGIGGAGGVTFKIPSIPVFFVIDFFDITTTSFGLSGAGDYYLFHNEIVNPLDWYFGIGVGVSFWNSSNSAGLAAAIRAPLGLSWQPINFLELYLQAVPQVGLRFFGNDGNNSGFGLWSNFWCGNLGIRFWF